MGRLSQLTTVPSQAESTGSRSLPSQLTAVSSEAESGCMPGRAGPTIVRARAPRALYCAFTIEILSCVSNPVFKAEYSVILVVLSITQFVTVSLRIYHLSNFSITILDLWNLSSRDK